MINIIHYLNFILSTVHTLNGHTLNLIFFFVVQSTIKINITLTKTLELVKQIYKNDAAFRT